MKRKVKPNPEGLTVEVSDIAGKEEGLLKAFQECRNGCCSCPTDEYLKLDSLEIGHSVGKISLRLKAKTGQELDSAEIERCLDHTEGQLDPGD